MAQSVKSNLPAVEANGIYAVESGKKGRKGKSKGTVTATVEGVSIASILDKVYAKNDKGDEFTLMDALKKVPATYSGMKQRAKGILKAQLEIGNVMLRLKTEGIDPLKMPQIKAIDRRDRSDILFVASNWAAICKLVESEGKKGVFEYNVGSLRKKLKQAQKAENVGTSDTSEASPKASASSDAPTTQGDTVHEVKTPLDLANDIISICQIKGWSVEHVCKLVLTSPEVAKCDIDETVVKFAKK